MAHAAHRAFEAVTRKGGGFSPFYGRTAPATSPARPYGGFSGPQSGLYRLPTSQWRQGAV